MWVWLYHFSLLGVFAMSGYAAYLYLRPPIADKTPLSDETLAHLKQLECKTGYKQPWEE